MPSIDSLNFSTSALSSVPTISDASMAFFFALRSAQLFSAGA